MNKPHMPQLQPAKRSVWVLTVTLLGGCASLEPHYQFRSNGSDVEVRVLTHPMLGSMQSQCAVRVSTRREGLGKV